MGSTPPGLWPRIAEMDRCGRTLWVPDGRVCSYEELLEQADPGIITQLEPNVCQARYDACQRALAQLARVIESTPLDLLIVLGDDQDELFHQDLMPALTVYWGESVRKAPAGEMIESIGVPEAAWAYGLEERVYPVASREAEVLIGSLCGQGFDVAQLRCLPDGQGIGHAFSFVQTRLLEGRPLATIPVMLNTYYPPNQPTPRRCYELSVGIHEAVRAIAPELKVGVVASGGLSHFVIDQELDHELLAALQARDGGRLSNLPAARLNSGSSEIRNWIGIAGAVEHLDMTLVDYQPCYRSAAGTGCAMGFAYWR